MLVNAVLFPDIVLALHVICSVASFGVLLVYPVLAVALERADKRAVPALLRARLTLSRALVNPGLAVVIVTGVYLAFKWHLWGSFVVIFGIAVAVIVGGLEGALVAARAETSATLAQRDVDAAGGGEVVWSEQYLQARKTADQVGALMAALTIAVLYVMVVN